MKLRVVPILALLLALPLALSLLLAPWISPILKIHQLVTGLTGMVTIAIVFWRRPQVAHHVFCAALLVLFALAHAAQQNLGIDDDWAMGLLPVVVLGFLAYGLELVEPAGTPATLPEKIDID